MIEKLARSVFMDITRYFEFEISEQLEIELQALLADSFPGFLEERIYFKQLPTFRLICRDRNQLVGQTGVVHRVVSLNGLPRKIFGIVDLCVDKSFRSKGCGRKLLTEVETLAKKHDIDFIMLFADDRRLYKANGFEFKKMNCTWLKLDEHKTLGVGVESINDCLMVKGISNIEWPDESDVDLLGHMF